ncbi:trypsin-like serine protease [Pilimelia anulata]
MPLSHHLAAAALIHPRWIVTAEHCTGPG